MVRFLVADMESSASTAYASALLTAAKTQITEGNGSLGFMTSASVGGKPFTRNQALTALDMAEACRTAIDLYNDVAGDSPLTFLSFGS